MLKIKKNTYTHTYIHTFIHTYIHKHVHTHTHSYIHTYIHAYIWTVREAENITNIEMTKISTWVTNNKIQFNNLKSKAMLLSRRKREERK